jgi:hypothetical protein
MMAGGLTAGLITNGDFETADFTGWSPTGTVKVTAAQNHTPGGSFSGAINNGSFSQTVTGTSAGLSYVLSYWLQTNLTGHPTNNFEVDWNGVAIPGSVLLDSTDFPWTEFDFTVTAAGNDVLKFQGDPPFLGFWAVDDVTLTESNIPEPGTLTCVALGALLLYRRKR